jgi:hypothetical protein
MISKPKEKKSFFDHFTIFVLFYRLNIIEAISHLRICFFSNLFDVAVVFSFQKTLKINTQEYKKKICLYLETVNYNLSMLSYNFTGKK